MSIKKLLLAGVIALFVSPMALADEIGGGVTGGDINTSRSASTMSGDEIGGGTPTTNDEIGGGYPTASDEIGGGSDIEAALAWWSILLQSF